MSIYSSHSDSNQFLFFSLFLSLEYTLMIAFNRYFYDSFALFNAILLHWLLSSMAYSMASAMQQILYCVIFWINKHWQLTLTLNIDIRKREGEK